jgi:hypothetical protein
MEVAAILQHQGVDQNLSVGQVDGNGSGQHLINMQGHPDGQMGNQQHMYQQHNQSSMPEELNGMNHQEE